MNQSHPLRSLFYLVGILLLMLIGGAASAQTATVVNNATDPRHETASQRIISVLFSNPLAGSTVAAQTIYRG
jgi:uncharacterized lipoprotein YajG